MTRQPYDRTGKWLLDQHGRSILYLGGARGVRSCRALQSEIVQPRQLPDGLLEVHYQGEKKPEYCLVEIATYPEKRLQKQVVDDLTLCYQHLKRLPEMLVLILAERGQSPENHQEIRSQRGWARIDYGWNQVELWKVPADPLLAANDVGLIPWVPLCEYQGPPEKMLRDCRERIEAHPVVDERESLLVVTEVLARLRFRDPELLSILGGKEMALELPIFKEALAENTQKLTLQLLTARFESVPADISARLKRIKKQSRLESLFAEAIACPDLEAFRVALLS